MQSCEIYCLPAVLWLPLWSIAIHCLVQPAAGMHWWALCWAWPSTTVSSAGFSLTVAGWYVQLKVLGNTGAWRRLLPGLDWLAGTLFPVALRQPSLLCTTRHHLYLAGQVLDVHFPMVVYKKLLGHKATFQDLKAAFPELGRGLQQLLD